MSLTRPLCILIKGTHFLRGNPEGTHAELKGNPVIRLILTLNDYLYVEAKAVLYSMFVLEAIVPRPCTSTTSGLELELLFINFRLNCARSVNGQWNAELKRIFPEVFVFPFCWTRVTRALGTRLILRPNMAHVRVRWGHDVWNCRPWLYPILSYPMLCYADWKRSLTVL